MTGEKRKGREHALVPIINGVVVDQHGFDLDGAQETLVRDGAIVDHASYLRILRGDIATLEGRGE